MHQMNRWSSVFGVAMLLMGAVFVSFQGGAVLADTSFSQIGDDIDGGAANDWLGWSVAMSADGSRVVTGTGGGPFGGGAGRVRVYSLINGVWTQTGADFDGDAVGDALGRSVAMSADGLRVAIGASGNGSDAGRVRVYTLTNGVWIQTGANINGEAVGDNSGQSVAMSADGSRVAIGAIFNDGGGSNAGQVRVYEGVGLTTTTTSIASATTTIAQATTTSIASATTTIAPVTTTVMSPLVLPSTGSQSDGWLIVGIFALILGTVLVTRRRLPR